MRAIHCTFGLWMLMGLLVPAGIGYLIEPTPAGAATAALWGAGADLRAAPRDLVDQPTTTTRSRAPRAALVEGGPDGLADPGHAPRAARVERRGDQPGAPAAEAG